MGYLYERVVEKEMYIARCSHIEWAESVGILVERF